MMVKLMPNMTKGILNGFQSNLGFGNMLNILITWEAATKPIQSPIGATSL
jgi:hypothetical protein